MQNVQREEDRWLQTEYLTASIPDSVLEAWDSPTVSPDIHLRPRNPFVSSAGVANIRKLLLNTPAQSSQRPSEFSRRNGDAPRRVMDEDGIEVYHKCNLHFNSPCVIAEFFISSQHLTNAPKDKAKCVIFIACLMDMMQETLSQGQEAGLYTEIKLNVASEVQVTLAGFSDTILKWASILFQVRPAPAVTLRRSVSQASKACTSLTANMPQWAPMLAGVWSLDAVSWCLSS